MALCSNVYRRGGVYWWRRRFTDSLIDGQRLVALSLRVREPAQARFLGAQLNAEAALIVRYGEVRMCSIVEIQDKLTGVVTQGLFAIDAGVLAEADRRLAQRPSLAVDRASDPAGSNPFSPDQERAMLLHLARGAGHHYAAQAARFRGDPRLNSDGRAFDPIASAAAVEMAGSFVYDFIAKYGAAARVSTADRVRLANAGLAPDMIDYAARETAFHASHETAVGWTLGPDRAFFENILAENGAAAHPENVRRLRQGFLQISAEILRDSKERHQAAAPPVQEIIAEWRRETASATDYSTRPVVKPSAAPSVPTNLAAAPVLSVALSDEHVPSISAGTALLVSVPRTPDLFQRLAARAGPASTQAQVAPIAFVPISGDPAGGMRPSFVASIESLARLKVKEKAWDEKTASQHLSVSRLFRKMAGTDDPREMGQSDIGKYRTLLSILPKNHGKSCHDEGRSLDEILVRSEDLDDDEIGLAAGTVNRHLTQLGNIIAHFTANGIVMGTITDGLRPKENYKKRPCFDAALDLRDGLFRSQVWTGSLSCSERLQSGHVILHDALYWVPLLGHTMLFRLSEAAGLQIADIDLERDVICIRNNSERRIKTAESQRDLPIPPDVLRLGFKDYVLALKALGHTLLFPELRLRGAATPLQNLFYKGFVAVLSQALPTAAEENKTFHCFRKSGNTVLIDAETDPVIRHRIMGHKAEGVNAAHYTGDLAMKTFARELAKIPNVTAHLAAHPIRLHDLLSRQ
ncbi:MAG: tyrosine-type recombinase/integrase [Bradyrhizobium sp.]|nr:tyrosine-type recombinase/integrase [Bradyrhizobium sp.]